MPSNTKITGVYFAILALVLIRFMFTQGVFLGIYVSVVALIILFMNTISDYEWFANFMTWTISASLGSLMTIMGYMAGIDYLLDQLLIFSFAIPATFCLAYHMIHTFSFVYLEYRARKKKGIKFIFPPFFVLIDKTLI